MLDLEAARTGETINHAQMPLEPQAAQHEVLRRSIREALMAAHRAGPGAHRAVRPPEHVAIGFADGEEIAEREDDPAVRQDPARQGQQTHPEVGEMPKMYDVRPNGLEQLDKRLHMPPRRRAMPQVVVGRGQIDELVRSTIEAGDARAGFVEPRRRRIRRAKKIGLDVGFGSQALEKLIVSLLRSSAREFRVQMGDEQYPQPALVGRRRWVWPALGRGRLHHGRS